MRGKKFAAAATAVCILGTMFFQGMCVSYANEGETYDTQSAPQQEIADVLDEDTSGNDVMPAEEQTPDEGMERSVSEEAAAYDPETALQQELEGPVTAVDEDGNVYILEEQEYTNTNTMDETPGEDELQTAASTPRIVNFNIRGNAVTNYTDVTTSESGYTNGAYAADAAYLGTQGDQVKFMLSGVIGLVSKNDVQVVNVSDAASVSYYYVASGRLYHRVTTNVGNDSYPSRMDQGEAPSYLSEGVRYYSYDGHYFYRMESFGAMLDNYNAGNRGNAVNASSPYVNYFQYLPLRSTSNYKGAELESMITNQAVSSSVMRGTGSTFEQYQNTYGVNALLMLGVAANESAWGASNIAMTKNNLFGLNAVDSSPGQSSNYYGDVKVCIKDFAETFMSKQYLNPNNWKYYGGFLGNKASGINVKYASDPYWGEKASSIVNAQDRRLGSSDTNVYALGIKDIQNNNPTNLNVRAGSSTSSTVLFRSGIQASQSFIILSSGKENGFYKVQSDAVLNSGRTGINSNSGEYNFAAMYAYVSADYIGSTTRESVFGDVSSTDWFKSSVDYVSSNGIMTGLNASTFGPAQNVSRAQFATIIYRLAGQPAVSGNSPFSDVAGGQWYSNAINWCNASKIMTGYTNQCFGLADNITREQIATIMYRYAAYKKYNTSAASSLSSFPDRGNVSGFALAGVKWSVGSELITGDGGKINPQGNASRAVCATIIMRFMKNVK